MESTLSRLLEELHPTEGTIHGARRYICYDRYDLNIRVARDYYFAKGVPGPGILATKLYLSWAVGKAPDFVLEMASPDTAAEDLTVKRKLYQEIGVAEYWRLDPTGGDLYGSPIAGDRLEGGVYQAIPMRRMREGIMGGHSKAAGIDLFWVDDGFLYLDPSKDRWSLPGWPATRDRAVTKEQPGYQHPHAGAVLSGTRGKLKRGPDQYWITIPGAGNNARSSIPRRLGYNAVAGPPQFSGRAFWNLVTAPR